jgi:hypothetical protein
MILAETLADISDALPLIARTTLVLLGLAGVVALVVWIFERWNHEQP